MRDHINRPHMAVLLCKKTMNNLRKNIVHHRVGRLVSANKSVKMDLCFFSINDIDLEKEKITAMYWDEEAQCWLEKNCQFPKILYMRGSPGKKNKGTFDEFVKRIISSKGILINYPNFNKFHVYDALKKDISIVQYLPDTVSYQRAIDLKRMLKKYQTVYLKAFIGRQGINVMRVEESPHEGYKYSYYIYNKKGGKDKLVVNKTRNFKRLQEVITAFFGKKDFLIQEAIDLIEIGDRKVDMRAEVQRNKMGELEVTGVSVRLGGSNSPITTHSDAYELRFFYEEILKYPKHLFEKVQSEVNEFLVSIYTSIEKCYGEYAEIGIDFAIDKQGHIRFIECNSQSTKVSLEKAYNNDVYQKSYVNILEYAKYRSSKESL